MFSSSSVTNPCIDLRAILNPNRSIKDLKPGQSGWTYPWAMWRDDSGKFWLRPNYNLHESMDLKIALHVTMTKDGVMVADTTKIPDYSWTNESAKADEFFNIPVIVKSENRCRWYL